MTKNKSHPTLIELGHIRGAQGLRGDVLVVPYTDDWQGLCEYDPLVTADGAREIRLTFVRARKTDFIARMEGVTDRTQAEKLKGLKLCVHPQQLETLDSHETGEYYHRDLIGLRVLTPDGQEIGTVEHIENYGAGDLLDIRLDPSLTDGKNRSELLPFTDESVPDINIDAGTLTAIIPDNFLNDPTNKGGQEND